MTLLELLILPMYKCNFLWMAIITLLLCMLNQGHSKVHAIWFLLMSYSLTRVCSCAHMDERRI